MHSIVCFNFFLCDQACIVNTFINL
uniref:Uncharacterized protein n=1 Tax=Anguilla anguilla TaxID=7936 RepID=A0A0E9P7I7_ANGAN